MSSCDAKHGIPVTPRTQPQGRSVTWRRRQLVAAGYDELAAQRLATDQAIDVHAMIELREQHRPRPRREAEEAG